MRPLPLLLVSSLLSLMTLHYAYANESDNQSSAEQHVEHVIIQQGKSQRATVSTDLSVKQTGNSTNKALQARKAFIYMQGKNNRVAHFFKGRIEQSSEK